MGWAQDRYRVVDMILQHFMNISLSAVTVHWLQHFVSIGLSAVTVSFINFKEVNKSKSEIKY